MHLQKAGMYTVCVCMWKIDNMISDTVLAMFGNSFNLFSNTNVHDIPARQLNQLTNYTCLHDFHLQSVTL